MITCAISSWQPSPATAIRPTFAIGDVHGRLDLLNALHQAIRDVLAQGNEGAGNDAPAADAAPLLVHLGDYIDRGPNPLACLQIVLRGVDGIETATLPGNHEQFMSRSLTAAEDQLAGVLQAWFAYNCGTAVARELGYDEPFDALGEPGRFMDRLRQRLGRDLLDRFAAMPTHLRLGQYLFVHGGLHPDIDIEMQLAKPWGEYLGGASDADPLWVRGPFLTYEGRFADDIVVVHGHTISSQPEIRHNRIGVDTGAFTTGRLTAVELRGGELRFITVTGTPVDWF